MKSVKKRDLDRTRREILDAAFFEVFSHGFQGVSVDDIVKRTRLTKGAFYHHFPTKLDLGYALVEEVIQPMIFERWIAPLEAHQNPLDGILTQMEVLIGQSDPKHLRLGCPLNNLVQEMAPIDAGFKKRLRAALELWVDGIDQNLRRGKSSGYLRSDVDTRAVARFIVMAHEGFYGMLKGINDPRIFTSLMSSLRTYFKSLES
jgi:AcrR family transcriptional regulator